MRGHRIKRTVPICSGPVVGPSFRLGCGPAICKFWVGTCFSLLGPGSVPSEAGPQVRHRHHPRPEIGKNRRIRACRSHNPNPHCRPARW